MKRINMNKSHLWIFYVFPLVFFTNMACYPTGKPDLEGQSELKDEKHFPNGTVVGRYTYMDNEGNPIQVKYYADDASYGVELKSIKVVETTGDPISSASPLEKLPKIENTFDFNLPKNTESDTKMAADVLSNNNFPSMELNYKYKANNDPYNFLNKEIGKSANRYKIDKPNPEYEVFYQNELKGPKKCNKEKVRVYFDSKETRNVRNAVDNYEDPNKFCEQF